jgi:hypothetical protein
VLEKFKAGGVVLSDVDIHFLPTARIHPDGCGNRIISSFKRHYRSLHIRWILSEVQKGNNIKDLKMDVLQAINYIIKSWEEIKSLTIRNYCIGIILIFSQLTSILSQVSFLGNNDSPTSGKLTQIVMDFNLADSMGF